MFDKGSGWGGYKECAISKGVTRGTQGPWTQPEYKEKVPIANICPRSVDPFHIVSYYLNTFDIFSYYINPFYILGYYIKGAMTFWTYITQG